MTTSHRFKADSIALEFGLACADVEELEDHRITGDTMAGREWLQVVINELYGEEHDVGEKLDVLLRMVPCDDPFKKLIVKLRSQCPSTASLKDAQLAVDECEHEVKVARKRVSDSTPSLEAMARDFLGHAAASLVFARDRQEIEIEITKTRSSPKRRLLDAVYENNRKSETD